MTRPRLGTIPAFALSIAICLAASTAAQAAGTTEPSAADGSKGLTASSAAPGSWLYPVIRGYGGVHPRPDLPSNLSPTIDYRVIVDVVHGESNPAHVMGSLVRLARLVNIMAYAGVPRDHVHVAAVIEGTAAFAAFTNAAYRMRFHIDNPNLQVVRELRQAGVELMVCAQALAENRLEDSDISADVTVTLSALTDFVVYGQRGYSYMQL